MAQETKAAEPGFLRREWGFVFFMLVVVAGILGGLIGTILSMTR